jgi:hypothetical protein
MRSTGTLSGSSRFIALCTLSLGRMLLTAVEDPKHNNDLQSLQYAFTHTEALALVFKAAILAIRFTPMHASN